MLSRLAPIVIFTALMSAWASSSDLISYEDLCKVDPMCIKLKDSRGHFISVSPAIKKFLNEARDLFIDYGTKYGVDPRAAAAAVAAENTMNVQASDLVQNWLASRGISSVAGRSFSFGLGQINLPAAIEAERVLAKLDHRPERSPEEISKALLTADGAAYYATGIVRKAQDDYKAKGIDISKRPDLLATLYNLGQTESRAEAAAAGKKAPQDNYFGFFVAKNLDDIGKTIGWDAARQMRTKPRASEEALRDTDAFVTARSGIPLLTSPSTCSMDGRAEMGTYTSIATRRDFPSAGIGKGTFKVISRGVDCDMQDYVLVQFENGKEGWIPFSQLNDQSGLVSKATHAFAINCSTQAAQSCMDGLRKSASDAPGSSGSTLGADNTVNLSLSTSDNKVLNRSYRESNSVTCADTKSYSAASSSPSPSPSPSQGTITSDQLDALEKKVSDLKVEITKRLALKDWRDSNNPVSYNLPDSSVFANCRQNMKACNVQIMNLNRSGSFNTSAGANFPVGDFLKLDIAHTDTRDLLFYLGTKQVSVGAYQAATPSASPSPASFVDFKKKAQEGIKGLKAACGTLKSESGIMEKVNKVESQVNAISEKAFIGNASYLGYLSGSLTQYANQCSLVHNVLNGNFDGPDNTLLNVGSSNATIPMTLKTIRQVNPGEQSLYEPLKGSLDNLAQILGFMGTGNQPPMMGAECNYDPLKTAALVDKLTKNNCVDQVFVPDHFAMYPLKGEAAQKVIYDERNDKSLSVRLTGCKPQGGILSNWFGGRR